MGYSIERHDGEIIYLSFDVFKKWLVEDKREEQLTTQ